VHHVGAFPELEDELTTYEPGTADSPDRMDALVWALTDLMVGFDMPISFASPYVVREPYGVDAVPAVVRDPESLEHPCLARGVEYQTGNGGDWARIASWKPLGGW
jgi:hypothetical protein